MDVVGDLVANSTSGGTPHGPVAVWKYKTGFVIWNNYSVLHHPPRSLALLIIEGVSVYSPCLFGKGIVVHARQTCRQQTSHLLKQTSSETIKPIDNSCMLSSNPSINPVVC